MSVGYPKWKNLDGCCQEVRVRRQVSDPDRNRAWECAELADSEVSEVAMYQQEAMTVGMYIEPGEMIP